MTMEEKFENWIRCVVGRDNRYIYLLDPKYEEERDAFYLYFSKGYSPWKALQEEYRLYG
jgi:hypothetical protein